LNIMVTRALVAIVLWLGLALPALATPVKVQDCANDVLTSGANTVSCTLGSAVTVNDMLAVCVRTGAASVTSVAGNGNTYQTAVALQTGPGIAMYWVPRAAAGSTTVTVTVPSSGTFAGLVVDEISGMGLSPTQDGTFAAQTYTVGAGAIQTGLLPTSGTTNEFLFGCGSTDSVQTPFGLIDYGGVGTPTANTNQGQTSSGGGQTLVGAYQLSSSSAGPYGFKWIVSASNTSGMIAAFISSLAPTFTTQAVGPNGFGGVCEYAPVSLTNLAFYPLAAAGTCTTIAQNVGTCNPGSAPSGTGSVQCPVCSTNGGAWLGC
jgi:hypothetical protein